MGKTDNTRPCLIKRTDGHSYWLACCPWPHNHRQTKQRNRIARHKARTALHQGEEPHPHKDPC